MLDKMRHRLITCRIYILLSLTIAAVHVAQGCIEDKCKCEDIKARQGEQTFTAITCARGDLHEMPSFTNWAATLYSFDLSNNFIERLDTLENSNVSILDLHRNQINTIQLDSFSKLNRLNFLDLSHNRIKDVHQNSFSGLEELKVLNLSHNSITALTPNVFRTFPNLEVLRLRVNLLRYIDGGWFTNLKRLTYLDIAQTKLHNLPENAFYPLIDLTVLDLSGNDFEEVPTEGLRSAANLKTLLLGDNPLSQLHSKSFHKIFQIEEIYIKEMLNLEEIGKDTFSDMKSLRVLDISYNPKLKRLDSEAFGKAGERSNESKITELYLQHNALNHLDDGAFPWCNVETLDLRSNPWNCDCRLNWVLDCHLKPELTVDLICHEPVELQEKLLIDVPKEEFKCLAMSVPVSESRAPIRLIVVTAGILSILILVSSVIAMLKKDDIQDWYHRRKRLGDIYYVKAHTNQGMPSEV